MKHTITPEQARLHAYADGQLDPENSLALETELAQDPEAREQVDRYQEMNELLRHYFDPVLDEPVPPTLLVNRSRPAGWSFITQMAAAALLLAVGLFGGFYLGIHSDLTPQLAAEDAEHVVGEVVMAYSVYTPEVNHPVEVSGDQRAHLVNWLSKRMGRNIVAPSLDGLDMKLLGGRLLASDDGPGALLMYENPQGQRVVIYACLSDEKSSAFHYAQQQGVSVYYWVDNEVVYAIAGEISRDRLLPIAQSSYDQMIF
ncbi:MAG: anti-sigma factor [Candidatus Thiodiazotropha sp.]